jgi:hypothetical protein
LIEYRDDFTKHATSPSHRDCSRQAVISRLFQIQSIASVHQNCSVATPPRLDRHSNTLTCFTFGAIVVGWVRISLIEASEAWIPRLKKFWHKTAVPISL